MNFKEYESQVQLSENYPKFYTKLHTKFFIYVTNVSHISMADWAKTNREKTPIKMY